MQGKKLSIFVKLILPSRKMKKKTFYFFGEAILSSAKII
jgi:hypothetical protein